MGPSDFIGLLGLVLAAFAIIPWTERKFYLLFFTKTHLRLTIIAICVIQLFMSFGWIQKHWLPPLKWTTCAVCIPATAWAYILAVLVVIFPVAIIIRGRFPKGNKEKLISLYKKLIASNDITQLVQYLETHHKKDIISFLQKQQPETSQLTDNEDIAGAVYDNIITDEKFIEYNARSFPYFLSDIITALTKHDQHNRNLVIQYSKNLTASGNADFLREMDDLFFKSLTDDNIISIENTPILHSLIFAANIKFRRDTAVAMGEMGEISLLQSGTRQFLKKEVLAKEEMDDDEYQEMNIAECWGQTIWTVVVFYRYLIYGTITDYKKEDKIFVIYYHKFTQALLAQETVNHGSYSILIIDTMINNLFSWLSLFNEPIIRQQKDRLNKILVCLGRIIEELAAFDPGNDTDLAKFQKRQIKRVVQFYLNLWKEEKQPTLEIMEAEMKQLLQNPSYAGSASLAYINLLTLVWDELKQETTIPTTSQDRFEKKILSHLNVHT